MKIFHNPDHHAHAGRHEMYRGRLVPCHEVPERLDHVMAELRRRPMGELLAPPPAPRARLERVHHARYLDFIASAWDEWVAQDPANAALDVLPSVWPARGFRSDVLPGNFSVRVGLFSFDAGTPLTAGAWTAAQTGGAARVAVLDVDYHHGNGTQTIFYDRADVLTASIHGDPRTEYPFYLGHADETGQGAGRPAHGVHLRGRLRRGRGGRQRGQHAAGVPRRRHLI